MSGPSALMSSSAPPDSVLEGGCHCRAVRFRVTVAADKLQVLECNCSICTKKGYLHLYVPPSQFQLLTDAATLCTYTFNTKVAQHHFCSRCGISPYYRPRSHPDDYDVNVRCLDDFHHVIDRVQITPFNGQRWEENVAAIQPPYLQPHDLMQRNSHSTS